MSESGGGIFDGIYNFFGKQTGTEVTLDDINAKYVNQYAGPPIRESKIAPPPSISDRALGEASGKVAKALERSINEKTANLTAGRKERPPTAEEEGKLAGLVSAFNHAPDRETQRKIQEEIDLLKSAYSPSYYRKRVAKEAPGVSQKYMDQNMPHTLRNIEEYKKTGQNPNPELDTTTSLWAQIVERITKGR